jgi:hypothetical protein
MKRLHTLTALAVTLPFLLITSSRAHGSVAHCRFELFGNARVSNDGVVRASSTPAAAFGGVSLDLPDGFLFSDLNILRTGFNLTDDGAGGGSPRFQLAIDEDNDGVSDGNVFVYLGTPPNFDDPGTGVWLNSGNLIGSTDERFDIHSWSQEVKRRRTPRHWPRSVMQRSFPRPSWWMGDGMSPTASRPCSSATFASTIASPSIGTATGFRIETTFARIRISGPSWTSTVVAGAA